MANQQRSQQKGPAPWSGRANFTTMDEILMGEEVLAGKFFLNEHPIIILFDSRASHDFVISACVERAKLTLVASGYTWRLSGYRLYSPESTAQLIREGI
jgi:hypothetical protein